MPERHSRTVPEGRAFYLTERLWQLAKGLPVENVRIDAIREFDREGLAQRQRDRRRGAVHRGSEPDYIEPT